MITNEFLAYCAGMFDGEGCVAVTRGGPGGASRRATKQFIIVVAVSNCHQGVLLKLQEAFGGTVPQMKKKTERHKQCWKWMLRNKMAIEFLKQIRPWLIIKGQEVDISFELYDRIKSFKPTYSPNFRGGMNPIPPEEIEARQAIVDKLRACPTRSTKGLNRFLSTTYQENQFAPSE